MAVDPPRLKRDWAGRHVRLLERVTTNGGIEFPPGEIMLVHRNYRGLELHAVRICNNCKRRQRVVTRVPESDVELLPVDFEPPRTYEQLVDEVAEIIYDEYRVGARGPSRYEDQWHLLEHKPGPILRAAERAITMVWDADHG